MTERTNRTTEEKADANDLILPARPSKSLRAVLQSLSRAEARMARLQKVMCRDLESILRAAEGERFGSPEEKRAFAKRVNQLARSKGLHMTYEGTPVFLVVQTSGSFELRSTKGKTPIKTSVCLPRLGVIGRQTALDPD